MIPKLILLGSLAALGACSGSDRSKTDPSRPAVVRVPGPVLASDTAKPDTSADHALHLQEARRHLVVDYSVLGAAVRVGDRNMLRTIYGRDAVLSTPKHQYNGQQRVVDEMVALGRSMAMQDFERQPVVTEFQGDTVVTDSGSYFITATRPDGKSARQFGHYGARWRTAKGDAPWTLLEDRLYAVDTALTKVTSKKP